MKALTLTLAKLPERIGLRETLDGLLADRVLMNSLYLVASTGVMAMFGFGFWLISAHLYSAQALGLSSTLINSTMTLSLFSLLGFDNVLVRFLAGSKRPHRMIDTSLVFTTLAAIVLAVVFLLAVPVLSPQLAGLLQSPERSLLFVFVMIMLTINTLTDSIFISWQAAQYILLADSGLSFIKVLAPVALVALGAFGLFTGFTLSVTAATLISLVALAKRYGYYFKPVVDRTTVHEVKRFSAGAYMANLAAAVPLMALPIMATNGLGSAAAAYFNLAMTIAATIFIVPRASANSLFAEVSKAGVDFGRQFERSMRQTALILVPAVVAVVALGHLLLGIFGAEYANGALSALRILAFSALPLAFNALAAVALKLHGRLRALVAIETAGVVAMLVTGWPLMRLVGVNGIAWSWTAGQLLMSVALGLELARILRRTRTALEVV